MRLIQKWYFINFTKWWSRWKKMFLIHIINSDAWIIEGVYHKWVAPSFQSADLIIFLDTDYSKRTFRIIKRFILQRMGLEKANYKHRFFCSFSSIREENNDKRIFFEKRKVTSANALFDDASLSNYTYNQILPNQIK